MSNAFLARVSRSFTDVSGIAFALAEGSEAIWVVEHPEDSGCSRTHCHFFVTGSQRNWDAWKNTAPFKTFIKQQVMNGNGDWSSKKYDATYDTHNATNVYEALKYMTKGEFKASFIGGSINYITAQNIYDLNYSLYVDRKKKFKQFLHELTGGVDNTTEVLHTYLGIVKPKKVTYFALSLEVVARYNTSDNANDNEGRERSPDVWHKRRYRTLCLIANEVLRENKQWGNNKNVIGLAQSALWEIDPEWQAKKYWDSV